MRIFIRSKAKIAYRTYVVPTDLEQYKPVKYRQTMLNVTQ